tara:strand:+ start:538 stop:741 length:204 start_codon:yes stop_codon:yes gene_type:complete
MRITGSERYDKIVSVIKSCKTIEQLNDAKNMVETHLQATENMNEYMFLMNHLFNREMILDNERKDNK